MPYRIVETDNYGGDYPKEKWACPYHLGEHQAKALCAAFNLAMNPSGEGDRYWKVVADGYELQPGFEP